MLSYRRSDPQQVSPLLYKEISDIKTQCHELETQLRNEEQRRLQVIITSSLTHSLTHSFLLQSEQEKEECDAQLVEVRRRLEEYESGHYGLKEAIAEIKQKKEELTRREQ